MRQTIILSILTTLFVFTNAHAKQKYVGFEVGHETEIQALFSPYQNEQTLPSGYTFDNILIDKARIIASFVKDDSWFKIILSPEKGTCTANTKTFCITTKASSKQTLKEQAKDIQTIIAAINHNDNGEAISWLVPYHISGQDHEVAFNYQIIVFAAILLLTFGSLYIILVRYPRSELTLAKKAVFSLIIVVLFFTIAEGYLRVFHTQNSLPMLFTLHGGYISQSQIPDVNLIWRLKPGDSSEINPFGLRDEIKQLKKPQGTYRILSLGESTTYGFMVEAKETYSEILQERLNEWAGTERFQVVNAGQIAYTSYQMWRYLQVDGKKFNPDMVLLYSESNDGLPTIGRSKYKWTDKELGAQKLRPNATNSLLQQSYFYLALRLNLFCLASNVLPSIPRVPEEDRRENLIHIQDWCRDANVPLVFIHPMYKETTPHTCVLTEIADDYNLTLIDLPIYFEKINIHPDDLFIDWTHPKPACHKIFADIIFKELTNLGLVLNKENK